MLVERRDGPLVYGLGHPDSSGPTGSRERNLRRFLNDPQAQSTYNSQFRFSAELESAWWISQKNIARFMPN
jgi:hypothetical protein